MSVTPTLFKWMAGQGLGQITKRQIILRATGDRKMWRNMIAHVLKACDT